MVASHGIEVREAARVGVIQPRAAEDYRLPYPGLGSGVIPAAHARPARWESTRSTVPRSGDAVL